MYRASTSEIIDHVDYDNDSYSNLSKSHEKIATHILAAYIRGKYMKYHPRKLMLTILITGITNKHLDGIIAYYPTAGIDSNDLLFLILDILTEIPAQTGCIVLGIVCRYSIVFVSLHNK